MLSTLDISRRKAAVAAGAGLLTIGAVALAWGNASASPTTFTPASSDEAVGGISGPCDEDENAGKPECATAQPAPPAADPVAGDQTPENPGSGPAPAGGEVRRFDAAGAGSVAYTFDGANLTLVDAAAAPGWRVEIEQASGRELDLDFRAGARRVQVDVELEDGSVRERVRFRDDATDERTETFDGVATRTEAGDDRSGPSGSDDVVDAPDDSDDRSGPSGDDHHGPSAEDDGDDGPDDSDDRGDRSGSDDD